MVETPFILIKWIVRAGATYVGLDPLTTEGAAEFAHSIARDVWEKWFSGQPARERARAIEEVAQASAGQAVDVVAEELAAVSDPARREALRGYVAALPGSIRTSLRRGEDPTGRSVSAALVPQAVEDVVRFLPARLPRFKEGDRPPGIGDWELVELLGTGGFGEVWKARNPHMTTELAALKFCLDPAAARTLRREAALLKRVKETAGRHPGIVLLLHTYLGAEPPCLEYEYVEGGTLAAYIQELHQGGNSPTPEEAAALVSQLAEIMAVCHGLAEPVVHRDLKPSNIMLQRARDRVRLRITDFGLGEVAMQHAKDAARSGLSMTRCTLLSNHGSHTPLYASVEQMRGEPADPRDDVYALGVIWWQVITGDLRAGAPSGRWISKLEKAGHPTEWVDLLAHCLEAKRADRLSGAGVLLERLRAGGKGSTRQDLPQVSIVTAREKSNSELQGSPNDERISNSLEMEFVKLPRTNVWMCVHETRIKDWEEYSKEVPSERIHPSLLLFRGKHVGETGEHPVVRVSALEAEAFVKWLNQREANPWKYYRLPTDHEWSVAVGIGECEDERATPERNAKRWKNKKPVYPWGNQWPPPKGSGNYADETAKGAFPNWDVISGYWDGYATTSPVKRFAPNSLGIYDLGGNCWEWTSSLWDGKNAGWRVLRGGSWGNKSEPELRSSCRIFRDPTTRYLSVGLRCVLVTSDG